MQMTCKRRSFLTRSISLLPALILPAFPVSESKAKDLAKPQGKIILTISGKIANRNQGGEAVFDVATLEAIGTVAFSTMTPWYNDKVTFEGVPMSRLLEQVGASGATVAVTALNDYTIDIPISDFTTHQVILATKRDGNYMPIKDKGPLFIVYNYDSNIELRHQRFYSRSAWQVAKIVVK